MVRYEATMPDGTVRQSSSFLAVERAYALAYNYRGRWVIAAVVVDPKGWPEKHVMEARRL